jgi:hypothetical protein
MDSGERTTGTRDEHYGLISVLYHALHGAENCEEYAVDAEAAGDDRLVAFFREAQATQNQLAERAKMLLGIIEALPEGTVSPDIPPDTTAPEDVSSRPADIRLGQMASSSAAPSSAVPLPDEDLIAETEGVAPDTLAESEDVATPVEGASEVPPDAPRTEDPPPRTGDSPPSPSEPPPPGEERPSEEQLPRQGP